MSLGQVCNQVTEPAFGLFHIKPDGMIGVIIECCRSTTSRLDGRMTEKSLTLSEVRALVAELVPRPLDGGPETQSAWDDVVGRETALYSSLPADLRSVVDRRLVAISGLPPPAVRRTRDVAEAARNIGLGQSAMYALLKRVSTAGPVTGLIPGRRTSSKASAARDGFGAPVDDWIATAMSEQPDITIAEVSRWIAAGIQQMASAGERPPKAPAMSALRERVHALRSQRPSMIDLLEAGADLLIDQCPLNLSVGSGSDRRAAHGVFIVDRRSTLILGAGMFVDERAGVGLASALQDFRLRSKVLKSSVGRLTRRPRSVLWVVPPVLAPQVADLKALIYLSFSSTSVHCKLGRSGAELTKLIGERLGPYRLLPRAVPDDPASAAKDGMPSSDIDAADLQIAEDGLRLVIDGRNMRMLDAPSAVEEAQREA